MPLLALAALLLPRFAEAGLPPAESILASMPKRREALGFETLRATGTLRRRGEAPVPVIEHLGLGRAHRVELGRAGGPELVLTAKGKRWRWSPGSKPASGRAVADLFNTFVGNAEPDPGGARGLAFLEALKIDPEVVSLTRMDGQVVFVIGARPWERDKPQLWVDRQLRVPVRLVYLDAGSGKRLELRLRGFGSAITRDRYPERIETWENGELVEELLFSSLEVDPRLDPGLFVPPAP